MLYSEDNNRKFVGAELKAKQYYDSCMDRNGTMEKLKSKPLQDFIDLVSLKEFLFEMFKLNWNNVF